ncbi:TetR/AcrR family transcriptional regulator [Desulfosarcina widdelii]|uniref:TetR/AcrR family transcriptional regulator n=1 Tax=Desulfosarcina widdelii TaxID=947919 RepID=UPI001478A2B9|nr:TetR/AcrR family transcriptional regulator [Desulfosarcina widdelii]
MNRSKKSRERILETAERLFALNGFHRTTITQLTSEAKVNIAAVNYHFGSKRVLIEQIIERRLPLISQRCLEELRKIRKTTIQECCQPDIEDVLRAFIEPALTGNGTIQNSAYFLLIASRGFYNPDDTIRNIFARHVKDNFQLCLELMRDVLPDLPERILLWRIHFAIGSLSHAMHLCGFQLPTPDISPPMESMEFVVNQLLSFVTCGMKAPCQGKNEMMPDYGDPILGRLNTMGENNE